jgi:4-oxalocrotonate tautomerase family enzyme
MPVVTIQAAPRDPTAKRRAIAAVTEALVQAYAVRPDQVTVFIHDVEPESWGRGGAPAADALPP